MASDHRSRAVSAAATLSTLLLVAALAFSAFAVASVVVGVARGGDSLLYGSTLAVPLQLNPDRAPRLPPRVHYTGWPAVHADVHHPTTGQMLLRSAQDLGSLVLAVAGAWLLRGFTQDVLAGDPFGAGNVRRLRRLGLLLAVGAPVVALLDWTLRQALYDDLPLSRLSGLGVEGFSVPGGALLAGLGAFVLAEVFAYGLRLREDVEATV